LFWFHHLKPAKQCSPFQAESFRLSLTEARGQLRKLIAADFDQADSGHWCLQAYLATQTARDETEWRQRLTKLQPSTNATMLASALARATHETWTTPGLSGDAARDAVVTENEACVDCLVAALDPNESMAPEGYEVAIPAVYRWGKREAFVAIISLGDKLHQPRAWSETEYGRFSPAGICAYYADRLDYNDHNLPSPAIENYIAARPLEEVILSADSMMRGRGRHFCDGTLTGVRSFTFGEELLTKALTKQPDGAKLAEQMINEEIRPKEVIARLCVRKTAPH
jgi:hypothetical protein